MKQTLYQILGVEPDASFEDIEVAYATRFEELSTATIQDPNRLVVLNQAREILSDVNRRAAYDASLSTPAVRVDDDSEPDEPGFLESWGRWLIAGAVLIGIALWLSGRDTPPAAVAPAPSVDAQDGEPVAETSVEPAPATGATETAAPAGEAPAIGEVLADNPIVGDWSCFDPVSGLSSRYDFRGDGSLETGSPGGQTQSRSYQVAGSTITVVDGGTRSTLAIEQLSGGRLVLNSGGAGHRLVCTR